MGLSQKFGVFMKTVAVTALKVDRFGRVKFGTLIQDGKQCVVVPRFRTGGKIHTGKCLLNQIQELNSASPTRVDNMTEEGLKEAISRRMGGKPSPRVLHGGGILTPLDQETASKLISLGFKQLEEECIIPI